MSIEKGGEYGKVQYIPTCDRCGFELDGELDFDDAVQAKKDAGWKSRQVYGEWEDVCCDCQEQERKSQHTASDVKDILRRKRDKL